MIHLLAAMRRCLAGPSIPEPGEPVHDRRRRLFVVAATLAVGAVLLRILLRVQPGDVWFYPLAIAQAGVWTFGGLLSGPIRACLVTVDERPSVPILGPLFIGIALGAVFLLGSLVVREFSPLRRAVAEVVGYAGAGWGLIAAITVTVVNGIAEEIFFRGGLFAALEGRRPVLLSTLAYAATTVATGNPMLVFAAVTVGAILALERRATGGVLAPIITHVTWSLIMLLALAPVLGL